jgi:hypothetical protein
MLAREYDISHTTLQVDHEGEVHGPQFLSLGEKPATRINGLTLRTTNRLQGRRKCAL